MRKWDQTQQSVNTLVDAHYSNDPYYPPARIDNPTYVHFKKGYLDAVPRVEPKLSIAKTFLLALEMYQATTDAAAQSA